jgi:membrane protease YdiL (CAAX protease family)
VNTSEPFSTFNDQRPLAESNTPVPTPQPWWANWVDATTAVGVWVVSIIFLALVPLVPLIPYIAYLAYTRGGIDQQALAGDKAILFISIMGVIPAHIVTFALIWLLVTYAGRYSFVKEMKLEWPEKLGPLWGPVLSSLIAVMLLAIGGVVTHFYGDRKTDLDLLVESSAPARWATAFIALCTAPVVEELIYRGLLYSGFEKAFSSLVNRTVAIWLAVVTVSTLFAGVHVWQYRNNLAVISVITVLSLTLTIFRAVSGKLLPCVVIHLVFNGIQAVIIVISPLLEKAAPTTPPPAPAAHLLAYLFHLFS